MSTTESPNKPPTPTAPAAEKPLISFYRPEEGHKARAVIGIALATLALYGCHSFYNWLGADTWHQPVPVIGRILGDDGEFAITGALLFAGGLALASLFGIFRLINFPKFVDFLIDTENELKKVSWASRRQVISESIVVVVTVLILGTYIFLVDSILILLKRLPWDQLWSRIL